MKFLGFFEPKLINKNNQNEEYYFIEKEKLSPVENLKEFISNFEGNTAQNLSDAELEQADFPCGKHSRSEDNNKPKPNAHNIVRNGNGQTGQQLI